MGKLATFASLPKEDRLAALEAMAELALAVAATRWIPPRLWLRRFPPVMLAGSGYPAETADVLRVRQAMQRAAANLAFVRPKCLPLALAAQRMLRRRGIPADLYLGSAYAPLPSEDRFHAWLKVGPQWVTGDCDEARFARLEAPPAHGA